jgi:AraC-like DNA-binding protein
MVDIKHFDGHPDITTPRRLMKYILIWCSSGTAEVVVDGKSFILNKNQVITITSGQVHYMKNLKSAAGYILEFTLDFFCKDDNDIELVFHNGLFCHFDMNEVIEVCNYRMVENHLQQIKEELNTKPYQYLISIHSRIELILVEINRSKIERGDEIYKPDALFLKFLELVRSDFETDHSLAYYAGRLGVAEAKINEQAKLHAGKTAQNVIYGLIISEAKRLLTYQKLSIKECAYKLGFNDPFYFSNFFKKRTKISPGLFQKRYPV